MDPLTFRRALRQASTDAERRLWNLVRRHGFGPKFRRQHTIGPYTLDLFCPEAALCVELDGGRHFTEEGLMRDEARDAYLRSNGIRVLRFNDRDVLMELDVVAEVIWRAVHPETASVAPPSPRPSPPAPRVERED